jgi:hypothetical protein
MTQFRPAGLNTTIDLLENMGRKVIQDPQEQK